ncbi:MAG: outer membrane beta-barrel protein [Devosia sp.]|nr:outer membrane beta-barrel protein [Devosia sp.]
MNRKLSVTCVVAALSAIVASSGAHAAGAATSATNWAGPYVGAQIGAGFGTESDDLSKYLIPADTVSVSGAVGGVYAGYTWQTENNLVLGIEGQVSATGLKGDWGFTTPTNGTLTFSSDWEAALKGRAGVAVDNALFYATAGVVWAHGTENLVMPNYSIDLSASATHTGWVAGVGVEYSLTDSLSARAEVDYTSFANQAYSGISPYGSGTMNASWTQTTATVGLSYHF